jgi:hypothetical protein
MIEFEQDCVFSVKQDDGSFLYYAVSLGRVYGPYSHLGFIGREIDGVTIGSQPTEVKQE